MFVVIDQIVRPANIITLFEESCELDWNVWSCIGLPDNGCPGKGRWIWKLFKIVVGNESSAVGELEVHISGQKPIITYNKTPRKTSATYLASQGGKWIAQPGVVLDQRSGHHSEGKSGINTDSCNHYHHEELIVFFLCYLCCVKSGKKNKRGCKKQWLQPPVLHIRYFKYDNDSQECKNKDYTVANHKSAGESRLVNGMA